MSIFEAFMQGVQADQQRVLNQMKMAQMQRLGPMQEQLQQMELERARFEQSRAQQIAPLQDELLRHQVGIAEQQASGEMSALDRTKLELEQLKLRKAEMDLLGGDGLEFKDVMSVNNKVTEHTKEASMIKSSAQDLATLEENASPAAKLAAVTKFMKALDPRSIVTETEQGLIYSSQGIPQELLGLINNLTGEGKLTGQGFADIVNTSKLLANSAISGTKDLVKGFLDVYPELKQDRRASMEKRIPEPFKIEAPQPNKHPKAIAWENLSQEERNLRIKEAKEDPKKMERLKSWGIDIQTRRKTGAERLKGSN